ncbi:MAG: hypothetical protein ACNA8W_15785, partial [Bradymonadaceae bacterium]
MSHSPDKQVILARLQEAGNALRDGQIHHALQSLRGLRADGFIAAGLDKTIAGLEKFGAEHSEAVQEWIKESIVTLQPESSVFPEERTGNKFKLPRPPTLSKSGPMPLHLSTRSEDDKETLKHPTVSRDFASKEDPTRLSSRLQDALKCDADRVVNQPPPIGGKSDDDDDDDFDLGLSAPQADPGEAVDWGFDLFDDDKAPASREPQASDDSVPP